MRPADSRISLSLFEIACALMILARPVTNLAYTSHKADFTGAEQNALQNACKLRMSAEHFNERRAREYPYTRPALSQGHDLPQNMAMSDENLTAISKS